MWYTGAFQLGYHLVRESLPFQCFIVINKHIVYYTHTQTHICLALYATLHIWGDFIINNSIMGLGCYSAACSGQSAVYRGGRTGRFLTNQRRGSSLSATHLISKKLIVCLMFWYWFLTWNSDPFLFPNMSLTFVQQSQRAKGPPNQATIQKVGMAKWLPCLPTWLGI